MIEAFSNQTQDFLVPCDSKIELEGSESVIFTPF